MHADVAGPKNIPAIDTFKPMTLDYTKAALAASRGETPEARLDRPAFPGRPAIAWRQVSCICR